MTAIVCWLRGWWRTLTLPRETRRFLARDDFDPSEFIMVRPITPEQERDDDLWYEDGSTREVER